MKKLIIIASFVLITAGNLFSQDSLLNYVEYARKNNPSVVAAYSSYKAGYEKIAFVKSLPDPKISAGFFILPVETRQGPQIAKLSVSQMFPWFGTLSAKEKQQAYLANVLFNKFADLANKVAFDVSKSYFELYFLQKEKEIYKSQIHLFKQLEHEALIKVQTNQSSSADVLIFQMAEEELQIKLQNINEDFNKQKIVFNLLINRDTSEIVYLPDTLNLPIIDFEVPDSMLSDNLQLQAVKNLQTSYEYKAKADKLSLYPQIGIGADYVFVGTDASLSQSGKDAFMPMLTISVPIWGKKTKSLNKSNEFLVQSATYNVQNVRNNLLSEYQKIQSDYENKNRNLKLYKQLIQKAKQSLEILLASYAGGETDFNQLIFIENSILKYQINLLKTITDIKTIEAKYNYLINKNI